MTPAETAAKLRQYNQWRRGNLEGQPMPDPREIGEAIDAAVEMIERMERIEAAAQNLVKMKGRHNTEIAYQRLAARLEAAEKELAELRSSMKFRTSLIGRTEAERDALRAELDALRAWKEEIEKQEPVGYWDPQDDMYFLPGFLLAESQAKMEPRYARPLPPAPSVPDGFSREDLEAVADGLDGYEKTVNVGNVTGEGDDHLESTTAYAARFIRTMLAATPETKP